MHNLFVILLSVLSNPRRETRPHALTRPVDTFAKAKQNAKKQEIKQKCIKNEKHFINHNKVRMC